VGVEAGWGLWVGAAILAQRDGGSIYVAAEGDAPTRCLRYAGWSNITLMQGPDEQMLAAFGEFVRAQRRLAQVSQRNLAKMSGVSDSYLSQIERGNYRPSPQVVKALAQAFGLEPKQLYTMLGFIDEGDDTTASVEQAVQLDPRLDASQKEALIRIYRSFVKEG
jgi:transcriptional regulator with XRE-family HTH domain